MGRPLRSGRVLKSLSPVKKDGAGKGGKTSAKKSTTPKAKEPAATKKVAPPKARGRGGKNTQAAASKSKKEHQTKQDTESEDEVNSESESEEEEVETKTASVAGNKQVRRESEDSESESEDEVQKVSPKPLKKSPATKKSPAKEESSDDEEESSSDDEAEEAARTPLKKTKAAAEQESSEDESNDESEDDSEEDKGFTDENAAWLKPKSKMNLMSSDSEEGDEFDQGESDDENMLEVERQSRIIDAEMAAEEEEAELEQRRIITQQTSVFHLPTPEELEEDENRVVPPSELRARIEDILEVLADFKVRREPGRSRSEYIERLGKDMAELFGYLQELVDYFLSMFGPNECLEFLEASDKNRPLVVRVNTLKARRKDLAAALMKRGVRLDPLAPWSKVGLKIYESAVPIGATPEYLAGHYMLQSAASMCPVMALGPQPGDRVMDMSAAPGGKTSYISQLMKNKGVVIANDLKAERQKATVANMHRLGVRNVVSCCYDGRKIGNQLRNSFDRILLDAPCSGLGVISRDPSVKVQRTIPDVQRCAHLQKELLLAAVDALNYKSKKGGGYMVYSTCSVAVAENEEVVNYLLAKRDVKLVETGLDFGKGIDDSLCSLVFH